MPQFYRATFEPQVEPQKLFSQLRSSLDLYTEEHGGTYQMIQQKEEPQADGETMMVERRFTRFDQKPGHTGGHGNGGKPYTKPYTKPYSVNRAMASSHRPDFSPRSPLSVVLFAELFHYFCYDSL